jgi:epoxyqueuosine reductase
VHALPDSQQRRTLIGQIATDLGFTGIRVGPATVPEKDREALKDWLAQGCHGTMDYMVRHADLRQNPGELVPGALSIISVRLPYWPGTAKDALDQLADANSAYISRYALGRDYHKVIRNRLQTLANRLTEHWGPFNYRAFTDSAPVMEVALASQAGLGWKGKHSLSLDRTGSWYFLGELICDLSLSADPPVEPHCGDCTRCMDSCPTGAITEAYKVDARRCISYLTIEHQGEIPEEFRKAMGNRIYGCDDCQLVCPWNRFTTSGDSEFTPRHKLDSATLLELYNWTEDEFLTRMAGSAIRRIGYEQWQRNISIALGNAPPCQDIISALSHKKTHSSALLATHIEWALAQQTAPR